MKHIPSEKTTKWIDIKAAFMQSQIAARKTANIRSLGLSKFAFAIGLYEL